MTDDRIVDIIKTVKELLKVENIGGMEIMELKRYCYENLVEYCEESLNMDELQADEFVNDLFEDLSKDDNCCYCDQTESLVVFGLPKCGFEKYAQIIGYMRINQKSQDKVFEQMYMNGYDLYHFGSIEVDLMCLEGQFGEGSKDYDFIVSELEEYFKTNKCLSGFNVDKKIAVRIAKEKVEEIKKDIIELEKYISMIE